eukprot:UN00199
MSYENALRTVDFLLEVLAEADKPAPQEQAAAEPKPVQVEAKASEPETKQEAPVSEVKEDCFQSVEDDGVKENSTVRVTVNAQRLDEMWAEAELGINEDKGMYLGAVGKITEIEEDDDTVQLRWANLDTCWIPIKACVNSNGAEPTLPNGMISHLG